MTIIDYKGQLPEPLELLTIGRLTQTMTAQEPHKDYPQQTLELSTGEVFYPQTALRFDTKDIAHALGMVVRFGGKCRTFYSVAQHSILVSHLMEHEFGGDPLEGLLHDAAEAYMMDIPTPIKRMLPEYEAFEDDLLRRIRYFYGLPETKTPECSKADKAAMFLEAHELIPSRGETFYDELGIRPYAIDNLLPKYYAELIPMEWGTAKYEFLVRYRELTTPGRRPL